MFVQLAFGLAVRPCLFHDPLLSGHAALPLRSVPSRTDGELRLPHGGPELPQRHSRVQHLFPVFRQEEPRLLHEHANAAFQVRRHADSSRCRLNNLGFLHTAGCDSHVRRLDYSAFCQTEHRHLFALSKSQARRSSNRPQSGQLDAMVSLCVLFLQPHQSSLPEVHPWFYWSGGERCLDGRLLSVYCSMRLEAYRSSKQRSDHQYAGGALLYLGDYVLLSIPGFQPGLRRIYDGSVHHPLAAIHRAFIHSREAQIRQQ